MPTVLPVWDGLPIQIQVKVRSKVSARLARVLRNAQQLASDPSLVASLLRQAVAETVLVQYRERFLARLPEAVLTQREKGGPQVRRSASVLIRRRRLRARLQAAYASEGARRSARIRDAQDAYSNELRLYRRRARSLPHGRFRSLAFRVLRLASDASKVKVVQADLAGIRLGIGSRAALDTIETPSATPKLAGRPTTSPHRVLWRHLEFGTGIYRLKLSSLAKTPYRLPGGGWFFGQSPEYSLHLRGSKGVHALWDKQGRPYPEDRQALQRRFRLLFSQALFGR